MKIRVPTWGSAIVMVLCIAGLGWIDWVTGYELNFFVFYFVPVAWGAWTLGGAWSVFLALLSALVWLGAEIMSGHPYSSPLFLAWNTTIRLASFLAIAGSMSRVRNLLEIERRATDALHRSFSEIKVLEAFLPICAQCKKIRDQQGKWHQLEAYISQSTNTQFSHGYCPDCLHKALAEAGLADSGDRTGS